MQNMNGKTALGLDNNVGALICYLGNIVCALGLIYSIIVLVTDKTNKLPRFHAFQSILLSAASFVIILVVEIFGAVVAIVTRSTILGMLIWLVVMVVCFGMLAAVIYTAIQAYKGNLFKLPVIGDLADKWSS
ncbi:MAG: DUF4870 domain-containing protein [Pyrinomonadaceae bacterium]